MFIIFLFSICFLYFTTLFFTFNYYFILLLFYFYLRLIFDIWFFFQHHFFLQAIESHYKYPFWLYWKMAWNTVDERNYDIIFCLQKWTLSGNRLMAHRRHRPAHRRCSSAAATGLRRPWSPSHSPASSSCSFSLWSRSDSCARRRRRRSRRDFSPLLRRRKRSVRRPSLPFNERTDRLNILDWVREILARTHSVLIWCMYLPFRLTDEVNVHYFEYRIFVSDKRA